MVSRHSTILGLHPTPALHFSPSLPRCLRDIIETLKRRMEFDKVLFLNKIYYVIFFLLGCIQKVSDFVIFGRL